MELNPNALDHQGYIVDQKKTDNIPFGLVSSDKNGCGWIAAYNFLKALDRDPDPEETLKTLEKTLLFGGFLGLNLLDLLWYIRRQKLPLNCALRPFHAQMLSETCRAGIILYRAGKTNHFAAFRREKSGKLRFYGAVSGLRCHDISLAEFYRSYVKFPLTVTITAK